MKVLSALRKVIDAIVALLFGVLVTLVLIQVVTRFFHMSQTWIDEISKFVFVWLTYIGGAITVRLGMNITFDLVLEGAKGKKFTVLFTIVNLFCLVFLGSMAYLGATNAWANRVQLSTMTHVNMGLMNLAIPIGCVLMIISQFEYYFRRLKERPAEEAAEAAAKAALDAKEGN